MVGQFKQQASEKEFLDCRHQDDDLGAKKDERLVPAGVALHKLDIRLVGQLDAEPFGDGLREIAKADGRNRDHRPCLQGES